MHRAVEDPFHDRWAIIMTRDDEVWLTIQLKDGIGAELRINERDIKVVESAFNHAGVEATLTARPRGKNSPELDYFVHFADDATLKQLRHFMIYMNEHAT